jgi:hypothetical protein
MRDNLLPALLMIHSGQVVRDIMPSRDVAAAFNVRQAS